MAAGKALLRGKSMRGKLALINIEKAESASSEQLTQTSAADPGIPESPPESPKAGGPAAQDLHGGARGGMQRVDSLEDDSPFFLNRSRTANQEPQGALDREYEATVGARIRMLKEMNSPEIANILQTAQAMQPLSRLEARQISSKLKRDLVGFLEEEMETAESLTLQEKMAMTKKIWRLRNEYDESKKD
eukprot:g2055.t1